MGATNSVAIALHKHHIDLVKYSSEHDGAFETVSDNIRVMIKSGFLEVTDSWLFEMKMKSKSVALGSRTQTDNACGTFRNW